jgi:2-hydroxy-3-keto-5-methylthiopentenyl-1-phosphate phosphatase
MASSAFARANRSLLVSDFDGTITRYDFYRLVAAELLPSDMPDYWRLYREGRLTHFEALQAIFGSIRCDEATIRGVVERMELDPDFASSVDCLKRAGWDVVVASAGCQWYIRLLLDAAGVVVPVWANPGTFEPGKGLRMWQPTESPYFSPTLGIDKAAIVREGLEAGRRVAFAGDGYPDLDAARLVLPDDRFARGDLAAVLKEQGLGFHEFNRWSEIADRLCASRDGRVES